MRGTCLLRVEKCSKHSSHKSKIVSFEASNTFLPVEALDSFVRKGRKESILRGSMADIGYEFTGTSAC